MPPIFPRWSNSVFALALVLLAAFVLGAPILLMVWVRMPWVTGEQRVIVQPVEFDHRHHVGDDGIDCRYCHDLVERSARAGIPPTELCLNCHNQIWNESPLLEPVWRSYETGEPIPWRKVHRLPDFVYFNHAAHVRNGVGCVSCHGRVDRMARVTQVVPLTMSWCVDCHRHPTPHLRPLEEVTSTSWDPLAAGAAARETLALRYGVDPGTDCTTCHR